MDGGSNASKGTSSTPLDQGRLGPAASKKPWDGDRLAKGSMAEEPRTFHEFAELCRALEGTSSRLRKVELIAAFLPTLPPAELSPALHLLIGRLFPEEEMRALALSWRDLHDALASLGQRTLLASPLLIGDATGYLEKIAEASGPGSHAKKRRLARTLLSRANPEDREWLLRAATGEMRHGVNEGVILDGIAAAAKVDPELLRRAYMLRNHLGEVAAVALDQGESGLREIDLTRFVPLRPMLAESAESVASLLDDVDAPLAFEEKLDGARLQIHKAGEEVRIFSRRLTEVTSSLPDIVDLVRTRIRADRCVLEGEAVAFRDRPLPFQELMRRLTRVKDIAASIAEVPLRLYLFDLLEQDEELLIDLPNAERWERLTRIAPASFLVERVATRDPREIQRFLDTALARGHEGLMAKRLDSPYQPGNRGRLWLKLKPAEQLDLVIIAAEWGSGRREGWLSNYHLGAVEGEGFAMLGKTYKGLTDPEFEAVTQRLLSAKTDERGNTVFVRPEIVVEVAYNEIQRSPIYPSGYALRFARIARFRDDLSPRDADSLETVRERYDRQFRAKARGAGEP